MKKIIFLLCIAFALLLSGCSEKYVATVGDEKITQGEFLFYLNSIKNQMSGTELQSEEDWKTQEIEGMRAIDFAKERALEMAALNLTYVEIADRLDVELSDEEESYVEMTKQNFINSRGGKASYDKYLKENNITDDFIEMLCESIIYSSKLAEIAVRDNPATEEEIEALFSEMSVHGNYKAKHILLSVVDSETMQPLGDEKKISAKEKADDILRRVKSGEDFDKLMHEFSEDPGLESNPDGYVFSTGEMVPEFESCVAGLEFDAIGFAESEFGYHIIKRLPLDMKELEEKINTAIEEKKLPGRMNEWKAQFNLITVKNNAVFEGIS